MAWRPWICTRCLLAHCLTWRLSRFHTHLAVDHFACDLAFYQRMCRSILIRWALLIVLLLAFALGLADDHLPAAFMIGPSIELPLYGALALSSTCPIRCCRPAGPRTSTALPKPETQPPPGQLVNLRQGGGQMHPAVTVFREMLIGA